MNLIKTFSVKALSQNLAVGNGSPLALPRLKHVPRRHNSNPHITFITALEEAENCTISLGFGEDRDTEERLWMGKTERQSPLICMYKRILAESAATETVEMPLAA
ncbi:hypothetical protein HDU87_001976 [Geranomyces variabilis]|uniref:Uncharacterized protein n=1 Tax=Geranomyces variabilis TaxID=109894 RepID=A0AAD5TMC5_9FUNG|nr:hypothetical protein HDU87_001976 [Geranomyces variabilis]